MASLPGQDKKSLHIFVRHKYRLRVHNVNKWHVSPPRVVESDQNKARDWLFAGFTWRRHRVCLGVGKQMFLHFAAALRLDRRRTAFTTVCITLSLAWEYFYEQIFFVRYKIFSYNLNQTHSGSLEIRNFRPSVNWTWPKIWRHFKYMLQPSNVN